MQKYSIKRILKIALLTFSRVQMPGHFRGKLLKLAGVNIPDTTGVSIGEGVLIDRLHPENITIGNHVRITMNCTILTHYFDTSFPKIRFNHGKVSIGNWCFLGTGVIICAPVSIGEYSIVGAGAIVTKNIPPYEIWGGNPAKFIKVRPGYEKEHNEALGYAHNDSCMF